MKTPILSLVLTLAFAVALPALAQERAPTPTAVPVTDVSAEALQRKIAQQAQLINSLQAQLKEQQDEDMQGGYEAPSNAQYNAQQVSPPPPPRRPVGVYQQPAEQRLTCADYSKHYFSRHPAMAAVCGATANPPQPMAPEPEDEQPEDPEAPAQAVSSTIRLPQHP